MQLITKRKMKIKVKKSKFLIMLVLFLLFLSGCNTQSLVPLGKCPVDMQTATNKDPNVDAAYGDPIRLERIYTEAAEHLDIVGLSIATRPDCLGRNALAMLERLAAKKSLWVELGLQTSNEEKRQNASTAAMRSRPMKRQWQTWRRYLIAPKWSGDKKRVLADMNRVLRAREIQPARE